MLNIALQKQFALTLLPEVNGEAELAFFLDLVASLQYKQFLAEQKFVVGKLV